MRFLFSLVIIGGVLYGQAKAQPSQAEIEKMKEAAKIAVERAQQEQRAKQGQQPPAQAKPPAAPAKPQRSFLSMQSSEVVAVVDGKPVTAGILRAIVGSLPPQFQQQASQNQKMLLQQYGMLRRLAAEAEAKKLPDQSPYKESLEAMRTQLLGQAGMTLRFNSIAIPEDRAKAEYEKAKDRYLQARVKAIYLRFGAPAPQAGPNDPKPLTEAEAKAKADDLVKQARAGADFVKLVKENSNDPNSVAKDGDFGLITRNASIPEHAKAAIFATKAGEITDPVRQPNGFYIFRVEEFKVPPYEEVKANLVQELRDAELSAWMQAQQNDVKIEEPASSAAPQPPPPAQAAR